MERKKGGLQGLTGELLLPPLGWSAAVSGREGAGERSGERRSPEQRRRFSQGCGEEEAELGLLGAGRRVPSPGSRQRRRGPTRAHPTISRLAAGYPLSPRQQVGQSSRTSGTGQGACGGGFLQTRSSQDDSRGGRGGGGERVRRWQASRSLPPEPTKSSHSRGAGFEEAA